MVWSGSSTVVRGMLLVAATVALTAAVSRTLMPDAFGARSASAPMPKTPQLSLDLAQSPAPSPGAPTAQGTGAASPGQVARPPDADRELALMLLPGLLEMGVTVPPMGPSDDGQAVLKAVNGLRREQGLPLFDEMNQDVADYVDIALDRYRERRANVIRAQMALDALGYDAGPVDGLLGPRTTSAIKRYQERMGLPVTGALTDEQIDALEVRSFDRAARRQPRG
jgi:Putative peptidoglycan binding domain